MTIDLAPKVLDAILFRYNGLILVPGLAVGLVPDGEARGDLLIDQLVQLLKLQPRLSDASGLHTAGRCRPQFYHSFIREEETPFSISTKVSSFPM